MSNDGDRLLATSLRRYQRSRATIRSSGFLLFLCHAGIDRGRMLLERAVSRKEQRKRKSTHLPGPDWPTPASGTLGSASTTPCAWCCICA